MTQESDRLYILLISVHGLIRANNLELGRDADTGGQTKYVVELARALSEHPDVYRVDLLTKRIENSELDKIYAETFESLSDCAQIVRIDCGETDYLPKEQLWDYLDSFADNILDYIRQQPCAPDLIHSHYADAGYVASRFSHLLDIPLVHTGHSLGRVKRRRLLASGLKPRQIEKVIICRGGLMVKKILWAWPSLLLPVHIRKLKSSMACMIIISRRTCVSFHQVQI